jgi:hypothetical protein
VALVGGAGIVEGGPTLHVKGQAAADHPHAPDQFVRPGGAAADWHEILDLAQAVAVKEPRDKDGRVGPVELLVSQLLAGRGDAEAAPLPVVEDGAEDARRIEVRQAEPVDGTVHPHQRRRAQIADDAIVLDGLVVGTHLKVLPCRGGMQPAVFILNNDTQFCDSHGSRVALPSLTRRATSSCQLRTEQVW